MTNLETRPATPTHPTELAPLDNLMRKAWRWSIVEFAAALGEEPTDPNVQERFRYFQSAAKLLGMLDDRTLAVLVADE